MTNSNSVQFGVDGTAARLPAVLIVMALCLTCCNESDAPETEQIRPVRAIVVQSRVVSETVVLTGHVMAEEEITLAFRIDGQLIDRRVSVGAFVRVAEVVARLDPQIVMNTSRAAEADLAAAKASLTQADRNEKREKDNYNKGTTPRAQYDQIVQQLQSAQAQVDAAQARLNSAQQQVGYTELRTEAAGVVTAKGAESGEVVRAGQPIVKIAREGRKDAVFDVPPRLMYIKGVSQSPPIDVALADNPNISITGFIREIGVQADPLTRTVPVKVSLPNAPDEMRFGATVTGRITIPSSAMMEIPSTALTESGGGPAVWVVSPSTQEVSLRRVQVVRYNPGSVIISAGLANNEIIVTAGVQALRPGQRVKLLGRSS